MGHRLSKIVTRTGDTGTTGMADGSRLSKASLRVAAIGEVDELNSWIGLLLTHELPPPVATLFSRVQHELFDLGGELAMPGVTVTTEAVLLGLESEAAALNDELPPLKEFILPGGSPAAAHAHLARTAARRAERALWALAETEDLNPWSLRYLNRLSDTLFICTRWLLRAEGVAEVCWRHADAR